MIRFLALFLLLSFSAFGQVITPPATKYVVLGTITASVGNGADLTEDTLQTFQVPAGQLANVGDRLHIVAGGTFGATTDSKTARVKFGSSSAIGAITGSTAGQTTWAITVDIVKSGSSTQSVSAFAMHTNGSSGNNVTLNQTDTNQLAVTVTGQNATNSVAGSITCRYLTVDFISGG